MEPKEYLMFTNDSTPGNSGMLRKISTIAFGCKLELAPSEREEFPDTMDFLIYKEDAKTGKMCSNPHSLCFTNLPKTLKDDDLCFAMERIVDILWEAQPCDEEELVITRETWRKIMDMGMEIFDAPSKPKGECDICKEGTPKHPDAKCCFNCFKAYQPWTCEHDHVCGEDCSGWLARGNAGIIGDMTTEPQIHKTAYDRYLMWWLTDRGYTVNQIAELALEWKEKTNPFVPFDSYLRTALLDRDAQMPELYWAFLNGDCEDASYQNLMFMRALLDDPEFFQYMEDTQRIKVLRKEEYPDRMGYITWHTNDWGNLIDEAGKIIDEKDLPAVLRWANQNMRPYAVVNCDIPAHLVHTEKGYGVAFSLVYDQLGRCKEMSHSERFVRACQDAATIACSTEMRDPRIEIVVIEDIEDAGIEQHEVEVILYLDKPEYTLEDSKQAFAEMAEELEHLWWNDLACD